MTTTITKETRRQLVLAVGERYRGANREDKERILIEFVATTGYHRKHAIRILNDARARLPESTCQGSAALIHRSSAELIHLAAGSRIGVRPPREIGRRRLPPVRQN
jgi:hypothetical protein